MELRLSNGRNKTIGTATLSPGGGDGLGVESTDGDGNLWIEIDGNYYGSLWFHTTAGIPTITLGHMVDGEWTETDTIIGAEVNN